MGARRAGHASTRVTRRDVGAQRLERGPPRVRRRLVVLVGLDVQVLPAHRAEAGTVGPAEDLVGDGERDEVTHPVVEDELPVHDVLRLQLFVRAGVGRLVLLGVDAHVDAGRREAAYAGPVQPGREGEAEHVAARRALDDELGRDVAGRGHVLLAAEPERLDRHRERLAVLLAGAQAERAKGEARHVARVARPEFLSARSRPHERFVTRVNLP